jgi:transcriptional regulator of aromatic amino acid metabolism
MRKVRLQAVLLANIDVPGPSSARADQKGIAARLTHKLSSRPRSKFLKVNCARVADEVISSDPVLTGPDRHLFTLAPPGNLRELEKIVYLQIQA